MKQAISVLLMIWVAVGAVAAGQRHYYSHVDGNKVATIAVTVEAGPLNYLGANPQAPCTVTPVRHVRD